MPELVEEVHLATAEDLLVELHPVTGRLWSKFRTSGESPNWLFRGQRDASWGLQPSAFRANPFKEFPEPAPAQLRATPLCTTDEQRLELHHVLAFVGLADALGHHIPGDSPSLRDGRPQPDAIRTGATGVQIFPPTEYLYMFALAQHYGVPTRLLDWTYTPLCAAYFAAEKAWSAGSTGSFAVWAMARDVVERRIGNESWEARAGDFVAFIGAPTASNPNLFAQAGLFTLVQCPYRSALGHPPGQPLVESVPNLDDLVRAAGDAIPNTEWPVLVKFIAPSNQAARLLKILAELRVHAGTVYPGLAGIVAALKEERSHG